MSILSELDSVKKELQEVLKEVSIVPIEWKDGKLRWIDVTSLPWEERYVESSDIYRVAEAIKRLEIRGAPAIGVTTALAVAMVAYNSPNNKDEMMKNIEKAVEILSHTRPTAYNLFWALNIMKKTFYESIDLSPQEIKEKLLSKALKIQIEDIKNNLKMGEIGEKLIQDGDTILTHCNTGSLATAGHGTALGVIKTAWKNGKKIKVIATETRPLLQGARLTAWELKKEGIPFKLITDNMVGIVMMKEMVHKVFVGADRILRTGHVINKIGTYGIAVLASYHKIPFYAVAPTSTFDLTTSPEDVIIENRDESEVTTVLNKLRIAPEGTSAYNFAFDMTPPELVSGIVTEKGIVEKDYESNIKKLFE
ncbi:S-methyl-5-thioribose-1-phosphate isomerase [Fervidicoccus fontis]|uniref:Putative methylthioribose-1-phosphate isomerase n=1 Tax=Fervidicoccus fontis (strain DSM 19380 / JCM 18336 / VKM B-2539 / Kam940) TaxID=1163730 RepID=H9ZZH1_FERFK|nr:translation initiation factor 2B subunit I family (IF-2BI) [Fervidicoccus fontis Kam940]